VFLRPDQMASQTWLGTDGKPGDLATKLQSASQFLADQKLIPAAAAAVGVRECSLYKGIAKGPQPLTPPCPHGRHQGQPAHRRMCPRGDLAIYDTG